MQNTAEGRWWCEKGAEEERFLRASVILYRHFGSYPRVFPKISPSGLPQWFYAPLAHAATSLEGTSAATVAPGVVRSTWLE